MKKLINKINSKATNHYCKEQSETYCENGLIFG